MGLHVLLAGMPLLAISAHVFDLVPMQLSAAILVIPLATTMIALTVFAPHPGDRVIAHGLVWGVVACAIYDVFRLDTVYLLGLWGDFIPTMGTWITGRPDDVAGGAVVGYLWRYIGDGGGIGLTFFVVASAFGLHRRSRAFVVLTAVGFAVAPVWAGLIGTVALAPRGQELMFPLTPATVLLSLIGHLIFGLILGLGFWSSRSVQAYWPWEPLRVEQLVRAAVVWSESFVAGVREVRRSGSIAAGVRAVARPAPVLRAASAASARPVAAPGPVPTAASSAPVPAPATAFAGPIARATSAGPVPQAASSEPVSPATSWSPIPQVTSSGPIPYDASSGPVPHGTSSEPVPYGASSEPVPYGASSRPVPTAAAEPAPAAIPRQRTSSTPPGARTLDPDTWEQWQRRLESTQPGRRAHGGRPPVPVQHG